MKLPSFAYEKKLWERGLRCVAGVDEVGRGCFAGPVVAGCAIFDHNIKNSIYDIPVKIDDSKKLTPRQRDAASKWIKKNSLAWGIGETSASLINRIGMGKATKVAFRRAVAQTNLKLKAENLKQVDFLLIDAFFIPYVRGLRRKSQLAIIDGDQKSVSIAAGSIIAKVYRDKLMTRLSKKAKFKKYGWGRNKGYGTLEHQEAIKKYGVTRYHRKKFVDTFLSHV